MAGISCCSSPMLSFPSWTSLVGSTSTLGTNRPSKSLLLQQRIDFSRVDWYSVMSATIKSTWYTKDGSLAPLNANVNGKEIINMGKAWLVVGVHGGRTIKLRPVRVGSSLKINAEVDYVSADEAKKLIEIDGYAVVDVRDKTQFNRAHIKDCRHVPLFIENQDNDPGTIIKRTVHNNFAGLFFGLPFTKLNPDFVQSVNSQFSPESKILLVCQGGLRSAGAARELEKAGYQNIACITSGLESVKPGTFDSVGSTELQNAGKAGLVTIQGKISAVLGTVLICAYLFITFFPDQAEKLFELFPSS